MSFEEISQFISATKNKVGEELAGILEKSIKEYPEETVRQTAIRAAVTYFEIKYPEEMLEHDRSMQELKETRANEFAANKDTDIRVGFRFPQSMTTRINMIVKEPQFLTDDAQRMFGEWDWVRKEFPRYWVPEKF